MLFGAPAPGVLVAMAALVALGCTSSDPAAPPVAGPCRIALADADGVDLALVGSGACAGRLELGLRVATGDVAEPIWHDVQAAPVEVEGSWQLAAGGVARDLRLHNSDTSPVAVAGLEWSAGEAALGWAFDRMLHNGYQSWGYAGIQPIPATLGAPDQAGTAPHGGDNEDVVAEVAGVSWWWTSLGDGSGLGLVAGADGGTVLKTYLAADRAPGVRLRIVQGLTGERVELDPGEELALDGLFLWLGDELEGLEAYAAHVAEKHPPSSPRAPALGGWGSWNLYYEDIDAAALREEAAWAAEQLVPRGLDDFLLDVGYEPHWGRWEASAEFGAELSTLAAEQQAAGLRPALWLAPFYVHLDDPLVSDHPDWFVHEADGGLRTFRNFGSAEYAALDVTSAEARAFVVDALEQLWSWGYRTFKIDFLFGGAVEGVRQQPVTSLQSYAQWMAALRQAVPEAHLVGCGAPLLPSVGWVDSLRTGSDIAFAQSPEPQLGYLADQARHTAARWYTDRWWALDPDVVLLRGQGLDDVAAWTAVVSSALAGGNYLLGDGRQAGDLRQAMALDPEVLAMTRDGVAARPLDFGAAIDPKLFPSPVFVGSQETAVPHLWQKKRADGSAHYLAAFAWYEADYRVRLSLPPGAEELVPPAAPDQGVSRQSAAGDRLFAVPSRGVRLFVW